MMPEPLQCSQGGIPFNKVHLDAKDAEIAALRLRNSALTDALRKVAILHRYRPAEGGGTVFVGACCEICEAECGPDQMIVHVGDCPLAVLNPT